MKKILLCFLILFCTSACTVEYSIEISEDSILETTSVLEYDTSKWDVPIMNSSNIDEYIDLNLKQYIGSFKNNLGNPYDDTYKVDGVSYYDMKKISNKKSKGIQYTYEYGLEEYEESTFLNQCFELVNVQTSGTYFTFSTSRSFKCFEYYENVSEFNIQLKTKYKVVSNNATEVDGNTYIWKITPDVVDKPIQFQVNMGEVVDTPKQNDMVVFGIILVVVLVIGFVIYKIVMSLQNKNNKI